MNPLSPRRWLPVVLAALVLVGFTPHQAAAQTDQNDIPAAISFDSAVYTIVEGTSRTITLRADPPPLVNIQIELTTGSRTTLSAGGYQLSTRIVTFEPSRSTPSFVVSIPDDKVFQREDQKLYLSFNLLDTTNSTPGAVSETVITVMDNDGSIASLEVEGADTLLEGGDDATLRVTLDRALDRETTIQIVIEGNATQGVDYTIGNTDDNPIVVMLPADSTSVERTLTIIDDTQIDPNETIRLTLNADHDEQITIGNESGVTLTIGDNDLSVVSFERAEYTIFEGTTGKVTLLVKPPLTVLTFIGLIVSTSTTTVSEMIANDDFELPNGLQIQLNPGQSEASFVVLIHNDEILQETRKFSVSFVPNESGSIKRGAISTATIIIPDNAAPIASLEVVGAVGDDIRLEERGSDSDSATLRVTLDRVFEDPVTIEIVTTGTATLGDDYTIGGTGDNPVVVMLPANNTSVETILEVIGDFEVEPEETIILTLAADNNRIIDDLDLVDREPLILTIEDNDVDTVDDHGNTIATATTLTLNTSVSGRIDPAFDVDYFSIFISTPTFVAIYTTFDLTLFDLETAGRLLNRTGTRLASDRTFPNFRITALLDPETYYIEVMHSFPEDENVGNYDLHVEVVTATEIGLNTTRSGTIDPADDVDYFSIFISTPTFVNIFTTTGDNLYTAGILLDNTGAKLAFDNVSGEENNFLIRTRLNQGTYYIQVMSSFSESAGNYVLHVDIDDVDDHSDTRVAATEIELDTSRSGTIDFAGDVDYFSIVISTPTFVNIFTTSDLNTDGLLRRNNMVFGIFNNDPIGSSNLNFLISTRIDSGTHSIRVRASSGGTGDYTLYVLTDDHSSTTETATTLTLNTTVSGTINPADEIDYFSIDISTPTFVAIYTTGGLNTAGSLQDNTSNVLQTDDQSGSGNNFLIRAPRLERGIYYIEVRSSGTETGNYRLHVDAAPQISLIIPSTLIESTNEIIGSTMMDVKHGEPFPVYIRVDTFADISDSLLLTLDGPQDGALPTTLMTSALSAGTPTWSELFVGNSTTTAVGQQNYRYCLAGTQNCSPSISVSYSSPAVPEVDVDDEIGSEWDFTLSAQTVTSTFNPGCPPNAEVTLPTLLTQEGNTFISRSFLTYTGIVDGDSYSLAYRDPNVNGGTYIDTHTTQYSDEPVALSGPGVWWWTNKAGFLCRGTYNIVYTPRPRDVVPQISLIIPSTLIESTNEIIGSTMRDVKHGEPFPVYIRVDTFADISDSLLLTLDGPQDGALPTTLMTSALSAGTPTWSELFVGNSTTTAVGQQNYRYCLAGTQNCSPSISVSYSSPAVPEVDVDDEIGSEWDFTLSAQTVTSTFNPGCPPNAEVTLPTLLTQEGNTFISRSFLTYTGIVDGDSYSLAYRDPNVNGGTYIDTHTTQYSDEPVALSGPGVWWWTNKAGFLCRGTYNIVYTPRPRDVVPQISLIIPSTLIESTNEIIGSTMMDVKHGEPFPVYIRVDTFADISDSLLLTLDGPQDGALPTTLMTSALSAGTPTWSELFVGNSTTTAVGQQNYRYCLAGTQNCSSTISVSYSSPAMPEVDVDDEIGSEWDFTLSDQTLVGGCNLGDPGTFPTLLSQEGNVFTSTAPPPEISTYTGIVDGDSYSLAYRDPDNAGGTFIDTLVTQYSPDPVALSGQGVWWWTNKAGYLCRSTYNIIYTPRPHIDSITVARMSVSEDVGNVAVTVTLTYPPVQQVVARLEIEGTATDADYQVERDINFGIGERQTTFNLVIIDDNLVEPNETIILKAVSQDLTLVGTARTTLTIEDNDVLTDHGDTIETATTLTLNTSVSGTIAPAGDADYFRIDISTSIFVTIYTTGDDLRDTLGTLLNSTGTELATNDDPRGAFGVHFLIRARLNPGTYYIRVIGLNSSTGNYSIQVDDDNIDDHSDIRFTATKIGLNTTVSGTIDPMSDVDYFSLRIDTATNVNIFTTGDELDTAGRLIDSVGTEVDSNNRLGDEDNFLISIRLNQGIYYIEVTGFDHDGTGDYVLHVDIDDVDVDVDDHGNTIATATTLTLTLDTTVSGTIDPAGDVDYFSIDISTTALVAIYTTGDHLRDTVGTLYDGTNNFLQDDNDSGEGTNFQISDRLNRGTYYIQVGARDPNHIGDYVLHVDITTMATTLTLNTSVSGTIDPVNDLDYFSIEINTPADVNIFTTGDDVDTVGKLYFGTNNSFQVDDDSGGGTNFRISDRLDRGTYYIEVGSYGSSETGDYVLHVDIDDVDVDDHGDTIAEATTLTLNTSISGRISGRIDPADDVDYFSIDISATTLVAIYTTVDLNLLNPDLDTVGRLLNRTGTELATNDAIPNFRITALLDRGTYYIEVSDFNNNGIGDYDLHVEVVTATEIGLNTTVSGTIDTLDDVDYFSLEIREMDAPADVNIFTTLGVDTAGILLDNTGAELTDNDQPEEGNNFLIRRLLERGTYYIQVMSAFSQDAGAYVLHVETVSVDDLASIASLEVEGADTLLEGGDDATLRVTLDRALDRETTIQIVIEGDATQGEDYTIGDTNDNPIVVMLPANSTSVETILKIIDDDLVEPDETISLTLNADHDEQITIGDESGVTLTIDDNDVDDHGDTIETATTLTLDTSVSGTINPISDVDYFRIDISTSIFVNIFTTGGLDTEAFLLSGTNAVIQFDDDSGEGGNNFLISDRLDSGTGTYYISMGSRSIGNYTLYVLTDDHSSTTETATTTLTLNTTVSGTINPAREIDYFILEIREIDAPADVNIFTTGGLDTAGRLINSVGAILRGADPIDDNFLIRDRLDQGTYYIEVSNSGPKTGGYELHVDADVGAKVLLFRMKVFLEGAQ